MNITVFQVKCDDAADLLIREERISSKFKLFKSRHPTFTYTIEKEESTNMLIIKHLSMYEQIN